MQPLPQGASFCRLDLGDPTLVSDDGAYLALRAAGPSALQNGDVRLTNVLGKAAGTTVGDADTVERGGACVGGASTALGFGLAAGATNLFALDLNGNGLYGPSDCVLLDRDASGALSRWDLRLSPCTIGNTTKPPGTLVDLGDPELLAGAAPVAFSAGVAVLFQDLDGNNVPTAQDVILVGRTSCPDCSLPAQGDVLLYDRARHLGAAVQPPPPPPPPPPPSEEDRVRAEEMALLRSQLAELLRAVEQDQAQRQQLLRTMDNLTRTAERHQQRVADARDAVADLEAENEDLRRQQTRSAAPEAGAALLLAAVATLAWASRGHRLRRR